MEPVQNLFCAEAPAGGRMGAGPGYGAARVLQGGSAFMLRMQAPPPASDGDEGCNLEPGLTELEAAGQEDPSPGASGTPCGQQPQRPEIAASWAGSGIHGDADAPGPPSAAAAGAMAVSGHPCAQRLSPDAPPPARLADPLAGRPAVGPGPHPLPSISAEPAVARSEPAIREPAATQVAQAAAYGTGVRAPLPAGAGAGRGVERQAREHPAEPAVAASAIRAMPAEPGDSAAATLAQPAGATLAGRPAAQPADNAASAPVGDAPEAATRPGPQGLPTTLTPLPPVAPSVPTKSSLPADHAPALPATTLTHEAPVEAPGPEPFAPPAPSPTEARGPSPLATLAGTPETARAVLTQMSEALGRLQPQAVSDGVIADIELAPAELGRVRISITGAEGGLHVSIVAERGDTQDLMRRHIDLLREMLSELGHGGVRIDLGLNARPGNGRPTAGGNPRGGISAPDGGEASARVLGAASPAGGTMDLRL